MVSAAIAGSAAYGRHATLPPLRARCEIERAVLAHQRVVVAPGQQRTHVEPRGAGAAQAAASASSTLAARAIDEQFLDDRRCRPGRERPRRPRLGRERRPGGRSRAGKSRRAHSAASTAGSSLRRRVDPRLDTVDEHDTIGRRTSRASAAVRDSDACGNRRRVPDAKPPIAVALQPFGIERQRDGHCWLRPVPTISSSPVSAGGLFLQRVLGVLLDQLGDDAGPAGLVAGAETRAGVAVEVLVEQDEVAPVRIASGTSSRSPLTGRRPFSSLQEER